MEGRILNYSKSEFYRNFIYDAKPCPAGLTSTTNQNTNLDVVNRAVIIDVEAGVANYDTQGMVSKFFKLKYFLKVCAFGAAVYSGALFVQIILGVEAAHSLLTIEPTQLSERDSCVLLLMYLLSEESILKCTEDDLSNKASEIEEKFEIDIPSLAGIKKSLNSLRDLHCVRTDHNGKHILIEEVKLRKS